MGCVYLIEWLLLVCQHRSNMDQLTRTTAIFFALLCVTVNIFSSNEFSFLGKYKNQYFCMTNSSNALVWVPKPSNNIMQQVSKYVFNSKSSPLNVIDDTNDNGWVYKQSLSNEIILDRRWERFPVFTLHEKKPFELSFSKNNSNDFEIAFSVSVSLEFYFDLCDESSSRTNCYKFCIQGYQTGTITVQKGDITKKNVATKDVSLPNHQWYHFKLSKKDNRLRLIDVSGRTLIDYEDIDGPVIEIKHILVYGINTRGYWRIHEVKYFYTNQNGTKFRKHIEPLDGSVCVSMFLKMCQSCKFQIEMLDTLKTINSTDLIARKGDWQEINFKKDNITQSTFFELTTIAGTTDPFWQLGDIRQCNRNGLRIIQNENKTNCQVVSDKSEFLLVHNIIQIISENGVDDFSVYSKSDDSISLRWKPTVAALDVIVGKRKRSVTDIECDLWHQYRCLTIDDLNRSKRYFIEMQSVHENTKDFTVSNAISAVTKTEPSKKPLDLDVYWIAINSLNVTWKHPIESNGVITFFNISVFDPNNTMEAISDLNVTKGYKPIYNYTIEANCSICKIVVSAYNGFEGEKAIKNATRKMKNNNNNLSSSSFNNSSSITSKPSNSTTTSSTAPQTAITTLVIFGILLITIIFLILHYRKRITGCRMK